MFALKDFVTHKAKKLKNLNIFAKGGEIYLKLRYCIFINRNTLCFTFLKKGKNLY